MPPSPTKYRHSHIDTYKTHICPTTEQLSHRPQWRQMRTSSVCSKRHIFRHWLYAPASHRDVTQVSRYPRTDRTCSSIYGGLNQQPSGKWTSCQALNEPVMRSLLCAPNQCSCEWAQQLTTHTRRTPSSSPAVGLLNHGYIQGPNTLLIPRLHRASCPDTAAESNSD